jgi:hypothetical protein
VGQTVSYPRTACNVLEQLSAATERRMIVPMTERTQQRYDHRLRDLVQGTRDVTIATDLGVPRSTARGWLGQTPKVVIRLDVSSLAIIAPEQKIVDVGAAAGHSAAHAKRVAGGCGASLRPVHA